jgi:glycine C-acetyltransferase
MTVPDKLLTFLERESSHLRQAGLFRTETTIRSAPDDMISVGHRKLVNLASNNYLGFATHPELKAAANKAMETHGVGVASPRPITGTTILHTQLERAASKFLGTEETLLFPSRYHANTGLFESLLGERDFVFCDALCNPSLADGARLARARVLLYRNNDLRHLEDRLKRSRAARFRAIVTDGVFSVDGSLAHLDGICDLADNYDALVVVDDAHGLGVLGNDGRGAADELGVAARVDLCTGTFSHALGGGAGGFLSGRGPVIDWLRQKSRPYLTSAALSPTATGVGLRALELLEEDGKPLEQLHANTRSVRESLAKLGFDVIESHHPIVAVRIGEVVTTQRLVDALNKRGLYATGLCYPVVPEGEARVRFQISAVHRKKSLDALISTLETTGRELRLI